MSDLSRYLKVEFYRAFTSKNFALTICLTFLLYLCSTLKEIFLLGRDAAACLRGERKMLFRDSFEDGPEDSGRVYAERRVRAPSEPDACTV